MDKWKPLWIGANECAEQKNLFLCFVKDFLLETDEKDAQISISADSRYILYINGERVGQGPPRYYTESMPFDIYSIGHLLKKGENRIAILNSYFGESTFQYRKYRQGVWFQLDLSSLKMVSDETVKMSKYMAVKQKSSRMCIQMGRVEDVDATQNDILFYENDYDISGFGFAEEIKNQEQLLWNMDLHENKTPKLAYIKKYPDCVTNLKKVKTLSFSRIIDVRDFLLGNSSDLNIMVCSAIVGTVLELENDDNVKIHISCDYRYPLYKYLPLYVDGVLYSDTNDGVDAEPFYSLNLSKGKHILAFDYTCTEHYVGLHLGINANFGFTLSGLGKQPNNEFFYIGPFNQTITVPSYSPPDDYDFMNNVHKEAIRKILENDSLHLEQISKTIPHKFVYDRDPFMENTRKLFEEEYCVPVQMQSLGSNNDCYGSVPISKGHDTEIIIDFGTEVSGFIGFDIEASEGTILDINIFEYMFKDKAQHTFSHDLSMRYRAKEGRQHYISTQRRGFRYLSVIVRGAVRELKVYNVFVDEYLYPYSNIGCFSCSDEKLNRIYEISANTIRICSEDVFVDCPTYEQTFWVTDFRIQALISAYVYDSKPLVKNCLELLLHSQTQHELIPDQLPSGWSNIISTFSFWGLISFYEYYMHSGDKDILKKAVFLFESVIEKFLEYMDDGLLNITSWKLVDWAAMDAPSKGKVAFESMIFYKLLRDYEKIMLVIGETSRKYEGYSRDLKLMINQKLWCNEKQAYFDCIHEDGKKSTTFSVQNQLLAILCDITDTSKKLNRCTEIVKNPPSGFVTFGSPMMVIDLFETYEKCGAREEIYKDIYLNYEQMLDYNATTTWEMYPNSTFPKYVDFSMSRSYCHGFGAAPAMYLPRTTLGIMPQGLAWEKVVISPVLGKISFAQGRVPHPKGGFIEVIWKIVDGVMELYVSVPDFVEVEVQPPPNIACNYKVEKKKSV